MSVITENEKTVVCSRMTYHNIYTRHTGHLQAAAELKKRRNWRRIYNLNIIIYYNIMYMTGALHKPYIYIHITITYTYKYM